MRRRWYELSFAIVVVLLVVGVVVVADALRPPVTTVSPAEYSESENPAFTTSEEAPIHPTSEAYARFADADAAWRADHAQPVTARTFAATVEAAGEWRPSPRQALRDRVYELVSAGRTPEAIVALEQWVERNPRDAEQLLELARLLNQVGRADDAVARYRQVIALQGGTP